MAGERTLPGLGLRAFWTPGSNGWNIQHDPDTRTLSIACQLRVISRVPAVPNSPSDGDIHILTSAPNLNAVAARDNGGWVYLTPQEGWHAYDQETNELLYFTGSTWKVRREIPDSVAGDVRKKLRVTGSGGIEWSYDPLGVRTEAGSTSLVATDAGGYVRVASAMAADITVPTNASVPFEIGTVIHLRQASIGQVTVVASVGVTINTAETLKLRKSGSAASLIKVGTDEWDLTGDLEAAP